MFPICSNLSRKVKQIFPKTVINTGFGTDAAKHVFI